MKIQKSPSTIYNISFTDEEFLIIKEGSFNHCYFTGYLWSVEELDNLIDDISVSYKKNTVQVRLSQDLPEVLYSVVQEFLAKAEV